MSEQLSRDVAVLAELFKAGGWTELRVESEGISLLFSTQATTPSLDGEAGTPASFVPAAVEPPRPAGLAIAAPPGTAAAACAIDPTWIVVGAPNLGTFYRSPKPGAAPFVEVGQRVEDTTEICLIEVMKLFTSVKAGVAGTVRHIAVADADLVEGGQALFYVERN